MNSNNNSWEPTKKMTLEQFYNTELFFICPTWLREQVDEYGLREQSIHDFGIIVFENRYKILNNSNKTEIYPANMFAKRFGMKEFSLFVTELTAEPFDNQFEMCNMFKNDVINQLFWRYNGDWINEDSCIWLGDFYTNDFKEKPNLLKAGNEYFSFDDVDDEIFI